MGIQEFSIFFKNKAQILTILVFMTEFTTLQLYIFIMEFTNLQLYISGNQMSKKLLIKSVFKQNKKSIPVVPLHIAVLRPEVPSMNS